jgi:hypothetical protein
MKSRLFTATELATFRLCLRKGYYRFELGLVRTDEAKPLRLGKAYHLGLEMRNKGYGPEESIGLAIADYEQIPDWADAYDWQVERETVRQLLTGYFWRYENDDLKAIAPEHEFQMPLVNPRTGRALKIARMGGKIDLIAQLADGRQAVGEYKTCGEDIGPESPYWLRLRGDQQVSIYMLGARSTGHDVATVIYDVTRKPTIQPRQVPLLDEDGRPVVLDRQGERVFKSDGKPRQTGDTARGYVLQSRPETPEEYGARLLQDIGQRPDHYYQRREVPRLASDLEDAQIELCQQAQAIHEARRAGRWFRNVSRFTCNTCEYCDVCLNNLSIDPAAPPSGFIITDQLHPELEMETA